jgi:hypothetical protein
VCMSSLRVLYEESRISPMLELKKEKNHNDYL